MALHKSSRLQYFSSDRCASEVKRLTLIENIFRAPIRCVRKSRDTISFDMSVRPHRTTRPLPSRIFMKFGIWGFLKKSIDKIQVSLKSYKKNGYFTRSPLHFWYHLANYLEWEMCETQIAQRQSKHTVLYSINFFSTENRAVLEKMWTNVVGLDTP